jgi:hypothetical protein
MPERDTVLRSMHDAGLAAWFGGSLMGAASLNGAAAQANSPTGRLRIASAGWDRWAPVNAAAIGTHLAGAVDILASESGRVAAQRGVGATSVVKTALTAAALGVTAYSRLLGKKIETADGVPTEDVTEPAAATPEEVRGAQRQERVTQWMIPVFTGAFAGRQFAGRRTAKAAVSAARSGRAVRRAFEAVHPRRRATRVNRAGWPGPATVGGTVLAKVRIDPPVLRLPGPALALFRAAVA